MGRLYSFPSLELSKRAALLRAPSRKPREDPGGNRVLSVSCVPQILEYRAAVLQEHAIRVVSALPEEVSTRILSQPFALAIFCHTLSAAELGKAAWLVRDQRPSAKLLLLRGVASCRPIESLLFDWAIGPLPAPEEFIATVFRMLAKV